MIRTGYIAALYVYKHGVYSNLPNVDIWDHERDALEYDDTYPIVRSSTL